jgi:hypothetical protein
MPVILGKDWFDPWLSGENPAIASDGNADEAVKAFPALSIEKKGEPQWQGDGSRSMTRCKKDIVTS